MSYVQPWMCVIYAEDFHGKKYTKQELSEISKYIGIIK